MRGVTGLALGLLLLPGTPATAQPHPPFAVDVWQPSRDELIRAGVVTMTDFARPR
jgi:hypothetical protein